MVNLHEYNDLIENFLTNKLAVHEFERSYIDKYTSESEEINEDIFQVLDWLFFKVDAFTDLPMEPEDNPDDYINEDQLRESAAKALQELKGLSAL